MATPKKSGAKKGAKSASGSAKKSGLIFPVGRVGRLLRKGRYSRRVSGGAAVFLASTLQSLVSEVLELSSKTIAAGSKRITPRALTLAVRHDADLGALLSNVTLSRGGVVASQLSKVEKKKKASKKSSSKKTSKKSSKATPKA